ncbi:MAG: hypothetical protein Q4C55_09875 [Eubacterium sp.]|nr:hypothetical protein [Eubacterium sp.]
MEMIGAIAKGIGQIVLKKSQKEYTQCHHIAQDGYQELTGMPLEMLLSLPEESIFDFMSTFGALEPEKVLVLAELLQTDAQVFLDEGEAPMGEAVLEKCRSLLEALKKHPLSEEQSEALAAGLAELAHIQGAAL